MLTFGAAVSTAPDHANALDEVIPAALGQLGGAPDLVVCFFTMEHADAATGIALSLSERTGTSAILGCTAQGVIGDGREVEGEPGLAVWMARLPGVSVQPFALRVLPLEGGVGIGGWPDLPEEDRASVLLLADPFTFPADSFLERLNTEQPGLPVLGGMVSGATEAGRHRLLHGTELIDGGAVGVALVGPVDIRAVVSQGCRPVGSPFAVTRGEGNIVHELGGRPATGSARCWPASTSTSRSCSGAAASRSARSSTSTRPASTGATSWSGACSGPTRRPARSPWPTASRSARPSSSTCATPTPPTRTSSCCSRPSPAGDHGASCCSPATAAAAGSSASPTTTPPGSPRPPTRPRWPASSPRASWARSAAATSCTPSPPAWPCSASPATRCWPWTGPPPSSHRHRRPPSPSRSSRR